MARKFFNQKVKKKRNDELAKFAVLSIIGVIIFIIIVVLIVTTINKNKQPDNAVIKIRDSYAVEVNSEIPDQALFFLELENVDTKQIKVSFDNVKMDTVGDYDVTFTIYGKKYKTVLQVVDTENPMLVTNDVYVTTGEKYTVDNFVYSCTDNSNKPCIIKFTKDADANYTKAGTYTIQITASDDAGNIVTGSAKLTIGKTSTIEKPKECKYGNGNYNKDEFTLAFSVLKDGCAISIDLYQDEAVLAPVRKLLDSETTKLKNEINKLDLKTKNIYLDSKIGPVLNDTGNGIVGYTLYMEVHTGDTEQTKEVIESFYLKENGTRKYIVNKYLK